MKTLLLLRHAKSSWDDSSLRDFDRPLADRGERDAPRVGKALAKRGPLPDSIISSPAVRARQTIEAVIKSAGISTSPQFDDSIYGATPSELMKLIRSLPDSSDCALLVGHNPTFEEVVSRLTGAHERMSTAALACIEFHVDHWLDVEDGKGKLAWLLSPKELH
ncbi:MAG TPA: histidine phosphatase family protein [Blastocatellia bacterium]|jgi:phosphohistidine phosphatase|nr:histidine phosphatase family protein [Blastocatellia bacterium]